MKFTKGIAIGWCVIGYAVFGAGGAAAQGSGPRFDEDHVGIYCSMMAAGTPHVTPIFVLHKREAGIMYVDYEHASPISSYYGRELRGQFGSFAKAEGAYNENCFASGRLDLLNDHLRVSRLQFDHQPLRTWRPDKVEIKRVLAFGAKPEAASMAESSGNRLKFYLSVPIKELINQSNGHCQSEIVDVPAPHSYSYTSNDLTEARDVVESYIPRFLELCASRATLRPNANVSYEMNTSADKEKRMVEHHARISKYAVVVTVES